MLNVKDLILQPAGAGKLYIEEERKTKCIQRRMIKRFDNPTLGEGNRLGKSVK